MDDFKVGMKSPSGCRIRMGGGGWAFNFLPYTNTLTSVDINGSSII